MIRTMKGGKSNSQIKVNRVKPSCRNSVAATVIEIANLENSKKPHN
jgi:hypothetical protein